MCISVDGPRDLVAAVSFAAATCSSRGPALTIFCVWSVLMSWQMSVSMTGGANRSHNRRCVSALAALNLTTSSAGTSPAGSLRQRQVRLDLVAVAAGHLSALSPTWLGEVGDDAVGAALGDAQAGRDVARPRAGVVCDAHQQPGVAGQETPVRHDLTILSFILVIYCLFLIASIG